MTYYEGDIVDCEQCGQDAEILSVSAESMSIYCTDCGSDIISINTHDQAIDRDIDHMRGT